MSGDLDVAFRRYSVEKLRQYRSRIQDCLGLLTSDQIWMRNTKSENSIGNLVLHLAGNVRQWIGTGIAGEPDRRERDAEFAARGGQDPAALLWLLNSAVQEAAGIIDGLTPQDLEATTTVQDYTLSKLEAIYHVVEHFSGHTGQIIFATKMLTSQDLGFYRHLAPGASGPAPDPIP